MLKNLLIALLVLVCLAVIAGQYIARNVRVNSQDTANGERVRVETPFGSVHVDARKELSPDAIGVPIYPGADREKKDSGGANVDIDWGSGEKRISVAAAEYTTTDSPAKVREFYHSRLPGWRVEHQQIVSFDNGRKRIISIKEQNGRTHIGIASVGEPAVN